MSSSSPSGRDDDVDDDEKARQKLANEVSRSRKAASAEAVSS